MKAFLNDGGINMSTAKVNQLVLNSQAGNFELPRPEDNWILKADQGYSPVQMVAAATTACGGYVYQEILTNSRMKLKIQPIQSKRLKLLFIYAFQPKTKRKQRVACG